MPQWRPDQTFYPSSKMAMQAPQETRGLRGPAGPNAHQTGRVGGS